MLRALATSKPFEFNYPATRRGMLELLAQLAAPAFEPMAFAGFGTPLQNLALELGSADGDDTSDLELEARIDDALRRWVATAGVGVVGELLLDVVITPPPSSFYGDLYRRRRDMWDLSLARIAFAIEALDPASYLEVRERSYKLRTLLDS
jgi:hypothetical protein